jgi:hypothetical protein
MFGTGSTDRDWGGKKDLLTVCYLVTRITASVRYLSAIDFKFVVPTEAIEPMARCVIACVPSGLGAAVQGAFEPAGNMATDLKFDEFKSLWCGVKAEGQRIGSFRWKAVPEGRH